MNQILNDDSYQFTTIKQEIMMTQNSHVDVYALIAKTSAVMKKAMRKEKKGSHPECIAYIQSNMTGKINCTDTISLMQEYNQKYDR